MNNPTNCLVCGLNIDPEIAIHNTGVPDCCDLCSIYRSDEYRERAAKKGAEQDG